MVIHNWDGLQWGHLVIHNHNGGYEYSLITFAFFAQACSNLILYMLAYGKFVD